MANKVANVKTSNDTIIQTILLNETIDSSALISDNITASTNSNRNFNGFNKKKIFTIGNKNDTMIKLNNNNITSGNKNQFKLNSNNYYLGSSSELNTPFSVLNITNNAVSLPTNNTTNTITHVTLLKNSTASKNFTNYLKHFLIFKSSRNEIVDKLRNFTNSEVKIPKTKIQSFSSFSLTNDAATTVATTTSSTTELSTTTELITTIVETTPIQEPTLPAQFSVKYFNNRYKPTRRLNQEISPVSNFDEMNNYFKSVQGKI